MVDGVDSSCNWFRVHCSVNRPCLSCSSFSVSPKSLTIWFDFNCPIDYFVSFSKLSGRLSVAGQLLPTSLPLLDSIFSHFCQYFSHLSIHPKREREREGGRERKFPCLLLRLLSFNYSAIIIPFVCFHHFHESSFRKCGSGLKQVSIRDWKRRRKSSESSHQRRHVDFKWIASQFHRNQFELFIIKLTYDLSLSSESWTIRFRNDGFGVWRWWWINEELDESTRCNRMFRVGGGGAMIAHVHSLRWLNTDWGVFLLHNSIRPFCLLFREK